MKKGNAVSNRALLALEVLCELVCRVQGLVKGLLNLKKGEKRSIFLAATEAYGLYDPRRVIFFPKTKLPGQICPATRDEIDEAINVFSTQLLH